MKVYYSLEDVPPIKNPVLTLGTYDGVHKGHQKIIEFLKQSADRINGETILFTFHPHPRIVLHPEDHNLELIQDIDSRIESLEKAGIDHLVLFPFTKEFSRLTATEFVRNILVNKLNVKLLTIGYNHHFGRNREGNIELLKELSSTYNFDVEEIPAFRDGETSVSSTKIRNAIKKGEFKIANSYLGKPFKFRGTVIGGEKIGATIGYPTANIGNIPELQILPKPGVYAVKVSLENNQYGGMMNIGSRPTVSDSNKESIEINIFDFNRDIYNLEIETSVLHRIRDEKSFDSLDHLKEQLAKDEANCKHILDQQSTIF